MSLVAGGTLDEGWTCTELRNSKRMLNGSYVCTPPTVRDPNKRLLFWIFLKVLIISDIFSAAHTIKGFLRLYDPLS